MIISLIDSIAFMEFEFGCRASSHSALVDDGLSDAQHGRRSEPAVQRERLPPTVHHMGARGRLVRADPGMGHGLRGHQS